MKSVVCPECRERFVPVVPTHYGEDGQCEGSGTEIAETADVVTR
jgi:hypothetical protein